MDGEQDDPLATLRDDVNRLASPLYRLLHPWARPTPAPGPRAPGQPGPDDPALSHASHVIHGANLGAVDNLRITILGSIATDVVINGLSRGVTGRMADIAQPIGNNGQGYTLASTATRVSTTWDLSLGAGQQLESLIVTTPSSSGGVTSPRVYVIASRTRITQDGTIRPVDLLIAGYVTSLRPLGWPGGLSMRSTDGQGHLRTFLGTQPAAGGEILEVVPFGARWRIQSIMLTLVTSANPATRYPLLRLTSGGVFACDIANTLGIAPSSGAELVYAPGTAHDSFGATTYQQLNPLSSDTFMSAGDFFLTNTLGIAVGDQYTNPAIAVEEWLVG